MKDYLHKMLNWFDHNRWVVICLVVALVTFGWMAGCQPMVPSLDDPTERIERPEFDRQVITAEKGLAVRRVKLDAAVASHNEAVVALNKQIETGYAGLEQQEELRQQFLDVLGAAALSGAQGTLNPLTLIGPGIALLAGAVGIGFGADNIRKRKVIADLKTRSSPRPA